MTLRHKKIRLNAIAPGWVTVEKYYKRIFGFSDADACEVAAEKVPGARSGEKVEIVKLAVLLCSEDVGNFIGQMIIADGGTTSRM